jgi:hypothetical protein
MNKSTAPNNALEHDTPAPEPPPMVPARPEFIRLPINGPCPWTGLTRAKLNELILPSRINSFKPPVRSVSLAPPGKTKGVRLIYLESLLDFLHRHSQGGESS